MGERPPADGERILRLAPHHVRAEVHASAQRASAELPETIVRFEGLCRPWSRPWRWPSASPPPWTIMSAAGLYRGAKPRHYRWASPPALTSSSPAGPRRPLPPRAWCSLRTAGSSALRSFAAPTWMPCRQNWMPSLAVSTTCSAARVQVGQSSWKRSAMSPRPIPPVRFTSLCRRWTMQSERRISRTTGFSGRSKPSCRNAAGSITVRPSPISTGAFLRTVTAPVSRNPRETLRAIGC